MVACFGSPALPFAGRWGFSFSAWGLWGCGVVVRLFAVTTGMERLPEELVLLILSFLDIQNRMRCALVCQQWRQLVADPMFWIEVNMQPFRLSLEDFHVAALSAQALSRTRKVDLTSCRLLHDDAISSIVQAAGMHLQVLVVGSCPNLGDASVVSIATYCPNLIILDLSRSSVTSCGLAAAFHQRVFPCLKKIVLSGCTDLSDEALTSIARACPALMTALLADCPRLTSCGVTSLAQACPQLRILDLSYCFWSSGPKGVDDGALANLRDYARSLRILDLSGCTRITDSGVLQLESGCPLLKKGNLYVWGCPNVSRAVQLKWTASDKDLFHRTPKEKSIP